MSGFLFCEILSQRDHLNLHKVMFNLRRCVCAGIYEYAHTYSGCAIKLESRKNGNNYLMNLAF